MDYDRLRELQAKFDENPRRYFAPLANEYRKGGNPKRAIEICRAHLAQMPGHMSGQVVYGQSLFEGGEFEEARKVFEGALVLDPENLIALRSLGDLSLQAGDTAEARSWYLRLLDADPKDAAVISLVSEIDASVDAGAPAGAAEVPGVDLDGGDQAIPQPVDSAETTSEFTVDFSFVDRPPDAAATESSGTTEAVSSNESPIDAYSSTESSPASDTVEAAESESLTTTSEFSEPEADAQQSSPPLGLEHHYPTGDSVASPPEAASPQESAPLVEPMGPDRDALDNWPTPPAAPVHQEAPSSFAGNNPEPFVNETMAQLYLQQGYKQLALRVYRQLSDRKPDEQSFKDRIAEIEASQAAETEGAAPEARRDEPGSIESPTPQPGAPRSPSTETPVPHGPGSQPSSVESPGFDGSQIDAPPSSPSSEPDSIESPVREGPRAEPEGIAARQPSMREFFATLGRRRPPRPAPAPASRGWNDTAAAASPPVASDAETPASLDSVFAGAKVSATDARAASALAGAFSQSARGASPPTPAATPTPRVNPRLQTQESEEDVAKFRAWLDGLTGE